MIDSSRANKWFEEDRCEELMIECALTPALKAPWARACRRAGGVPADASANKIWREDASIKHDILGGAQSIEENMA